MNTPATKMAPQGFGFTSSWIKIVLGVNGIRPTKYTVKPSVRIIVQDAKFLVIFGHWVGATGCKDDVAVPEFWILWARSNRLECQTFARCFVHNVANFGATLRYTRTTEHNLTLGINGIPGAQQKSSLGVVPIEAVVAINAITVPVVQLKGTNCTSTQGPSAKVCSGTRLWVGLRKLNIGQACALVNKNLITGLKPGLTNAIGNCVVVVVGIIACFGSTVIPILREQGANRSLRNTILTQNIKVGIRAGLVVTVRNRSLVLSSYLVAS
jgi:hypothetical protein